MIRFRLAIIFTLILSVSHLSSQTLKWDTYEHNFGSFSENLNEVTAIFSAVNVGNEPVSIINAAANCGCTIPSYSREPVAPGDSLRISVVYNAVGRPGKFSKKVTLTLSDGTKTTLFISGTVIGSPSSVQSMFPIAIGDIHISNRVIPMGSTLKGRTLSGGINIYNSSSHPIIPAVEGLPPYLRATFKPQQIPVGERGFLSLTAQTAKVEDWGTIESSFLLIPDQTRRADSTRISVVMILREDFSKMTPEELEKAPAAKISTTSVDFDRITGNTPIVKTFTITNEGHTPLIIRSMKSADDAINARIDHTEIKSGRHATVTVTLSPSLLPDDMPLNACINFIFNDPAEPNAKVRVVGVKTK